jgi:DNA-binding response OmpR family regulator
MSNLTKILLVEDDADLTDLLTYFLNENGYEVTGCSRGQAALLMLQQSEYDVILLNMKLPDISGNEVLVEISKQEVKTPVIIVSGNTDLLQQRERVQAVVSKPFDLYRLLDIIERALLSK